MFPVSALRRFALAVLIAAATAYVVVLAYLFVMQRDMVFPRDPLRVDPARAGLAGIEEILLSTEDGERLVAWHVPPREGRPVIVYFHGNAGNLGRPGRLFRFRAFANEGYGLLAVSYRGYGGSSGAPSETGLHADARAAYAEAIRRHGADRVVLYGESLGTGVAVRLATEARVRAVVLDAPYTSTAAVASELYPYVPIRWLMLDQFRSDDIVGRIAAPILTLHGDRDTVIPVGHGVRLHALAAAPKRLVLFADGGHEDLPARGSLAELREFLDDVFAGRIAGEGIRRR